jgi:uncharacterized protein YhaN
MLIIVAFDICHTYRSSARNTQNLEYNVKALKGKLAQLEKVVEGKEICLSKTNDSQLKLEFSQLREKVLSLQSKAERLENLMKE